MKETFYFPHDNNAHNDPKLMSLFMEHGLSGIGLYWIIIEIMHQQEDGIISEKQFKDFLKWYSMKENNSGQFVEQVLNTFETQGIFCFEDGNVFSKRVVKNKQFRSDLKEKRSFAGKKSAEKRALKRKESTHVEQKGTHDEQGKEKKGKEKEIKHKYGEYKNVLITDTQKIKLIKDYGEEIFLSYIKKLDEGIQQYGYKYKDHNLVMRKWIGKPEEGQRDEKKNFNEGL